MLSSSMDGSGLSRPKTRKQWVERYKEFDEERKRKRSQISESGSSSGRSDAKKSSQKNFVDDDEDVIIIGDDEDVFIREEKNPGRRSEETETFSSKGKHVVKEKRKEGKEKKAKIDEFEFWDSPIPRSGSTQKEAKKGCVSGSQPSKRHKSDLIRKPRPYWERPDVMTKGNEKEKKGKNDVVNDDIVFFDDCPFMIQKEEKKRGRSDEPDSGALEMSYSKENKSTKEQRKEKEKKGKNVVDDDILMVEEEEQRKGKEKKRKKDCIEFSRGSFSPTLDSKEKAKSDSQSSKLTKEEASRYVFTKRECSKKKIVDKADCDYIEFLGESMRSVETKKKKMGGEDDVEFLGESFSSRLEQTQNSEKENEKKKRGRTQRSVSSDSKKDDDDEEIAISKEKIVVKPKREEVNSTKEKEKKKRGDFDKVCDVEFLGDVPCSNRFGLSTGSGSGSKVGSVGGASPGNVAYDDVASSTSKKIKESVDVVGAKKSHDSDESVEPRDTEEDIEPESSTEEEDNDDSEDEDFKEKEPSSSEQDDDGSEESEEEEKALEDKLESSLAKDKNADVEKDVALVVKTKTVKTKTVKTKTEKQKGVVSRLRTRVKGKYVKKDDKQEEVRQRARALMDEDENSDSSDDHVEEKKVQKQKREVENLAKRSRKKAQKNLNIKEILLNTILETEGKLDHTLQIQEENIPRQLPLKFRFEDEIEKPREKEEWELEIDSLFADLEMYRHQSEFGSNTQQHVVENAQVEGVPTCQHLRILDEQIGIICKYCSMVFLESKYILPQFANRPSSRRREQRFFGESEQRDVVDFQLENANGEHFSNVHPAGTVWDIVPKRIQQRMYPHQRDGFEFLWKNVGGDLYIEKLKEMGPNEGKGCIISHAPGTGKTGLSVVFLQSFMKLFPMCRPVVIAPRSMLLTWENEFKKWDVDIPFHNLNNTKLSGKERGGGGVDLRQLSKKPRRGDSRMMKLFSWANGFGILGSTYALFEKLAGGISDREEDVKMRKVLLKYPGLLILDEGHTPRSDKSLMWRALSKVETQRRVILSGTPFQNNFHELYNTMSLILPGLSGSTNRKRMHKACVLKEKWNSITNSIVNNSNKNDKKVEELKQMIAPYAHVYKGSILLEKLPGLNNTLVYLKLTELQKNQLAAISMKRFMEQDCLRTLITVHPSLSPEMSQSEAKRIELDLTAGVKTRFVYELINLCCAHSERVIVFSRLIQPLELIRKQLCTRFHWTDNQEVLYMDGKIDAKYRQDRIKAFNDPTTDAKVLLASTTACCEGINLTGASRIVLLDVVWNPSITRQAICRAYRLGQKKRVYVYHLISEAFEAEKYACQARKDRMSDLVFSATDDNPSKTDPSGKLSDDIILDMMVENQNLREMFDRIVHEPKNQQTEQKGSPIEEQIEKRDSPPPEA